MQGLLLKAEVSHLRAPQVQARNICLGAGGEPPTPTSRTQGPALLPLPKPLTAPDLKPSSALTRSDILKGCGLAALVLGTMTLLCSSKVEEPGPGRTVGAEKKETQSGTLR